MRWISLRTENGSCKREGRETKNQLHREELGKRNLRINPMLDPSVKSLVRVAAWLLAEQQAETLLPRLRGKHKRQRASRGLRCRSWLYVGFERSPRTRFAIGNIEQLIGAGGVCETCQLGAEIVRQVVAFERRKAKLKADVDKESGRDQREKDRAEGVKIMAGRPDDRFPAAPLLDGGHGYFSLFWLRLARSSCAFAALVVWTWRKRTVSCSWASLSPRSSGSSVFIKSI